MSFRKLWIAFGLVVVLSFAVLGWTGVRIYQEAPPVPDRVMTTDGREVIGPDDIDDGQNVWQSMGGMEIGSIWGHGSYVAPDWTADWLHREAIFILDAWSGTSRRLRAARLPSSRRRCKAACSSCCARTRTTRDGTLTIDPVRAAGVRRQPRTLRRASSRDGRDEYAIPAGALTDPREPAHAGGVLLLDVVGGVDEPARRRHHLHEQLAARAAGRQPADGRRRRLDRRQHHPAARRHRAMASCACVEARAWAAGGGTGARSAARRCTRRRRSAPS